VTQLINANATPTFGIFVQGIRNVPFDPATNRIFVRFKDSGAVTGGSTSVAVLTLERVVEWCKVNERFGGRLDNVLPGDHHYLEPFSFSSLF